MIKNIKYIILLVVVATASFFVYHKFFNTKTSLLLPPAQNYQDFVNKQPGLVLATSTDKPVVNITTSSKPSVNENIEPPVLAKDEINLNISFTSQAPTANWVEPFENACEEASVLMIDYYYQNKKFSSKKETEELLLSMVKWQEDNWGEHSNLSLAKLAEYISLNYSYRPEIIDNPSINLIKQYLNNGLPIIVPANGKKLANPNFRNGGPDYHMLVIKGYLDDKFITNDPGTRLGADFIYTQDNLMSSMADWDGNKNGASGPKRVLILRKS